MINTIKLLKGEYSKLQVRIAEKLRQKMFSHSNPKLRRKHGYSFKANSFNLKKLLSLGKKVKINKNGIFSNITDIKTRNHAAWCNFPLRISVNKEFIEGVGYYIGDGRLKTNSGLSAVSIDIDTVKSFLNWLIKCFNAGIKNIRINIFLPCSNFNERIEKRKWAKLLRTDINSINKKYKYKSFHKTAIEVNYSRAITKLVLDKMIPIIKERCLIDKSFAIAYIRGIMAAEGSPRYNAKSHHRSIHLKMKNKREVKYVSQLLHFIGLTPSFLFSKQDNNWLAMVSGYNELKELEEMNVFKLNYRKRQKLRRMLSNYHHKQAKKGRVREFYLTNLFEFERKYGKHCTAKQLSEYIKRDKTRVINVLRKLQKDGLLKGERIRKVGTPFEFTIRKAGKEFILKKSLLTSRLY